MIGAVGVTTVLAIIGVATGVTGTVVSLFSYFRDRAVLEVTWNDHRTPVREPGDPAAELVRHIDVFLANHGRQPIAIVRAGLRYTPPPRGLIHQLMVRLLGYRPDLALGGAPGLMNAAELEDGPLMLSPGQLVVLTVPRPEKDDLGPAGRIFAFATDSRRRTVCSHYPIR